jgi:hypothetical protein
MKALILSLALVLGVPTAADTTRRDEAPGCKSGGNDEGGSCNANGDCQNTEACEDNDLSPSFQDSPVNQSFNPVVCLPMATCNIDGRQQGQPSK